MALCGIALVALNLRTSIASLSPLFTRVAKDIPIDTSTVSLLGLLPPAVFAVFGFIGSRLARRIGVEGSILIALVAVVAGHLTRSFAGSTTALVVGTLVSLTGMGAGNVLLTPATKKFFPGNPGAITSMYATLIGVSTAAPPLLAVLSADAWGWRGALSIWAVLALVAIAPWAFLLRQRPQMLAPEELGADTIDLGTWRSSLAWALGILFSVSAINGYAMFAWLPQILVDTAGMSSTAAGSLLALYGALGIPLALLVPALTSRMRSPFPLLLFGILATVAGNVGLAFAPRFAPVLWVIIAGLGPLLFPACLTLFQLRARTENGAAKLSATSQTIGYVLAITGPLVVGWLYSATGEWVLPLAFLSLVAIPGVYAAIVASRKGVIEDASQ